MKEKIRIERCHDEEFIKSLHKEIFPVDELYTTDNKVVHWIALDSNNECAGFCTLSIVRNSYGFLARAGIKRKFRGNNLQCRFIRVREKFLKSLNLTKMITYTKKDNIPSCVNLQKCNYFMYAPVYSYADNDCIYWIKEF